MSIRIWATIGPASFNREVVQEMERLGVRLFRINLSHTPLSAVAEWLARIGEWTDVPICLDSEGAQIRNETMVDDAVAYAEGDTVKVHFEPVKGDRANISFSPRGVARQFAVGDRIHVDFDHLCLRITGTANDGWMARVEVGGEVGSNKAADLERPIKMPAITEKDRAAIAIGRDMGIRHFALSFASSKQDILEMREIAGPGATIVSKVESPEGLSNLHEIIEHTDHLLIDRGDLSRRIALEKIPFLQRRIIAAARARKVPVFVATNLLESMVRLRSPTRAEVNDVVSTIQMGADGLVLAAETAVGKHPVEAVRMIHNLIDLWDRWTPETSISEIIGGEIAPDTNGP